MNDLKEFYDLKREIAAKIYTIDIRLLYIDQQSDVSSVDLSIWSDQ